jgi:hypothetical protein
MVPVQLSNVLHSYGSMSKPALHTEITADGDWIKTYMLAQKTVEILIATHIPQMTYRHSSYPNEEGCLKPKP